VRPVPIDFSSSVSPCVAVKTAGKSKAVPLPLHRPLSFSSRIHRSTTNTRRSSTPCIHPSTQRYTTQQGHPDLDRPPTRARAIRKPWPWRRPLRSSPYRSSCCGTGRRRPPALGIIQRRPSAPPPFSAIRPPAAAGDERPETETRRGGLSSPSYHVHDEAAAGHGDDGIASTSTLLLRQVVLGLLATTYKDSNVACRGQLHVNASTEI
jgi:hypothetical protein